MAFFEKLGDMAKNLGERTGNAIETSKLHSRINSEKTAAGKEMNKIGEFYYNRFVETGEAEPEVLEFCQKIKAHYEAVEGLEAEIERIKAENEALKEAARAGVSSVEQAPVMPVDSPVQEASMMPEITMQTDVVPETTVVPDAPVATEAVGVEMRTCPVCGMGVAQGKLFCTHCGNKME